MQTTSINRKLVLGLAAMLAFFALQAVAVLAVGRYTEREVVEVARRNTHAQVSLARLATLTQQIRRYEKEYFIYIDVAERRTQYQKEWTDSMNQIQGLLSTLRLNADRALTSDDSLRVDKWMDAAQFYASEMGKVFAEVEARVNQAEVEAARAQVAAAARASKAAKDAAPPAMPTTRTLTSIEANDMIKAGKDRLAADLIKGVNDMFKAKSEATLALTSVTNEGFERLIYSIVGTVMVGIAIGLYLLVTLPRSVTHPIALLTGKVDAISRGDTAKSGLDVSVREFQGLSAAVERMRLAQELMVQRLRKPTTPPPAQNSPSA